ncbi:MAG: SUMF1/EgtB/PvdO family nonheme iron enzyme, partial [Candidatus Poribacteria bacterium]
AEELRRKLDQEQAQQDAERADMTLGEAATRLSELRKQITDVEKQVRAEVIQARELVRPGFIQAVFPKDEFETTAEFADRKLRIEEGNASERVRHQREVAAADASLPGRLQEATAGFEVAIAALRDRERPVGSDEVTATLGPYDADLEMFPYEVVVKGVSSPLTGSLEIPRDAARKLREGEKAGALMVTVAGRLSEDGSVRLGEPSFGAPNLPKMYPGRSGRPTQLPRTPNRSTRSPEADRLLQELYEESLSDARRLDIGVQLAKMGDPRPGVGVENGVPDVDWVHVSPGGSVDIKGTRQSVSPFYLARYPVTYAQYKVFVKASDGFNNPAWWRGMPSKYTPPARTMALQRNRLDNAPRVDVSWYQAVAFTRWLNARLKAGSASLASGGARVNGGTWEVRLPTEWEWQWAAQGGSEQRAYPWGSWQAGHTNAGGVLKSTTAVGMYPLGSAASGALDMSGNVWEWCLSKYGAPYSTAVDGTNEYRVLRGGSFGGYREFASSSFRNGYFPHYAAYLRG